MSGRRPLRVLHVVRRYEPLVGGTERYVKDLAEAQALAGRDVAILTLDHDVTRVYPGRLAGREVTAGVTVLRIPGMGNARIATTSRPDVAAWEIARADVVHVHDLRFLIGLASIVRGLRRRPLVVHTHGLLFHTASAMRWKRLLMRTYFGPLVRFSGGRVVASSAADRAALLALAPYLGAQTVTLENAVALTGLLELERRPVPGLVLAIGRIAAPKRLDTLARGLSNLTGRAWTLVVAGAPDAAEVQRLRRLAMSLGIADRLTIKEGFEDRGPLLSMAEVAAFPSPGEGFGIALLEAMAAGVPVLANDIPAHRALLGSGLSDRLVDFGDPAAVAAAMNEMLDRTPAERAALGRRERERARRYDLPRLSQEIDDLYRSVGLDP